jgi:hypothetical protein
MQPAFSSKHPFVQKGDRWIASINDGSTVFEDKTPGMRTAWRRLAKFLENKKLYITNLRLEFAGKSVSLLPAENVDGYWWSTKEELLVGLNQQVYNTAGWVGIGQVKKDLLNIIWVRHDGFVKEEVRPYQPGDPAVILNG